MTVKTNLEAVSRREFLVKSAQLGVAAAALSPVSIISMACGGGNSTSTSKPPLRVAYIRVSSAVDLYGSHNPPATLAQLSFPIEKHEFTAGPAMTQALLAGDIDIIANGVVPSLIGGTNNVPARAVLSTNILTHDHFAGNALIVRNDSSIKSFGDLRGKKVAIVAYGTLLDFELAMMEAHFGLNRKDFTIVLMAYPDMGAAIDARQVDAAYIFEPFYSRAIQTQNARRLVATTEVVPHLTLTVVQASDAVLKARPDDVAAYLAKLIETERWIMGNYDQARQVNQELFKLDASIASKVDMGYFPLNGALSLNSVKSQLRAITKLGLIKTAISDEAAFLDVWFAQPFSKYQAAALNIAKKVADPIETQYQTDVLPYVG